MLEKSGPYIHNLSLQVYGKDELRQKLIDKGVKEVHNWEKSIDMKAAGFSVEGGPIDAHFFDDTKNVVLDLNSLKTAQNGNRENKNNI